MKETKQEAILKVLELLDVEIKEFQEIGELYAKSRSEKSFIYTLTDDMEEYLTSLKSRIIVMAIQHGFPYEKPSQKKSQEKATGAKFSDNQRMKFMCGVQLILESYKNFDMEQPKLNPDECEALGNILKRVLSFNEGNLTKDEFHRLQKNMPDLNKLRIDLTNLIP